MGRLVSQRWEKHFHHTLPLFRPLKHRYRWVRGPSCLWRGLRMRQHKRLVRLYSLCEKLSSVSNMYAWCTDIEGDQLWQFNWWGFVNHFSTKKKMVESCSPGFRRHNEQCIGEWLYGANDACYEAVKMRSTIWCTPCWRLIKYNQILWGNQTCEKTLQLSPDVGRTSSMRCPCRKVSKDSM